MCPIFVSFFRSGNELHRYELNGFRLASLGDETGELQGLKCLDSVALEIDGNLRTVTQADFNGPVAICLNTRGQQPRWFALATSEAVARYQKAA